MENEIRISIRISTIRIDEPDFVIRKNKNSNEGRQDEIQKKTNSNEERRAEIRKIAIRMKDFRGEFAKIETPPLNSNLCQALVFRVFLPAVQKKRSTRS